MRNAAEKKRIGKGDKRGHRGLKFIRFLGIYIYIVYILYTTIYTCGRRKRILCNLTEPGLN